MNHYPVHFVHCFECRLPVTPTGRPLGGGTAQHAADAVARLCEMLRIAYRQQVTP